jgi:23S rRNA (cytosine1962-C5)-methyltransferase
MEILHLKPNRPARVLHGHPWVFAGEVEPRRRRPENGESAELLDDRGRSLGTGIWSNTSQIAWRRYSRAVRPFDSVFVAWALGAALARRPEGRFRRLVWSEADHLPGLVVDQFDTVLVIQALTAGADRIQDIAADWFRKNLTPAPTEIIFRNDASAREREGLPLGTRTASGTPPAPGWFQIEGVDYQLDLANGQKTGFYLDQREQHLRVATYARGRRVLDAFCNQGGFALQAAKAGAASVLGVDSSQDCIQTATGNATRNGLTATTRFQCANMFDWFTKNRPTRDDDPAATHPFDLIILDPPPFARDKNAMPGALRGYKELNLRALKLLAPGGILATYSCSQRIGIESFLALLAEASADARRDTRLLEITGQPADHPVLLDFPESHYLKGAILRVE